MSEVRVALVGVGNCASSFVQGLQYYRDGANDTAGLLHADIGGYRPADIAVVAAWDVDRRKVGRDVASGDLRPAELHRNLLCRHRADRRGGAHGARPRRCRRAYGRRRTDRTFVVADARADDHDAVVARLRDSRVDVMMNYLPVGSQRATEFYAGCALAAGVAFVNSIPVFIASDPLWAERFRRAGVPIVGDDIKAQIGATIVHRVLTDLFAKRGAVLDRTYQINTGGNTDFLNMSNRARLKSKKISKTEAVQAVAETRLEDANIHIGPSDYVAWQNDNKVAFIRMEGRLFGGVPMNLELRLSVEDSPNSAGVAIDMVRCAKLARDRGLGGPIEAASAFFCKHPPLQMNDDRAAAAVEAFIAAA